jgi:hypothetical protein
LQLVGEQNTSALLKAHRLVDSAVQSCGRSYYLVRTQLEMQLFGALQSVRSDGNILFIAEG